MDKNVKKPSTEMPTPPPGMSKSEDGSGQAGGSFNLKWLLITVVTIWPWLLGSIIISLIIGNVYLRYYTPIYRASAEMLIADSKNGEKGQEDLVKAMKTNNPKINLDDEIEVIRSRSTMLKVAENLKANIIYMAEGRFKKTELYTNKPFEMVKLDTFDGYFNCKANILSEDELKISFSETDVHKVKFGDTVKFPEIGRVVFQKTDMFTVIGTDIFVGHVPIIDAALGLQGSISYASPKASSNCVLISMVNTVQERAVDVINELMYVYRKKNVEDRTRISESTMEFIDERMKILGAELSEVERDIERFKQSNNIADMTSQAGQLVNARASTSEKLEDAELQLDLTGSISDYLQKIEDRSVNLPASLLENRGLSDLITRFKDLNTRIEYESMIMTPGNPVTKALLKQREEVQKSIVAALASSKKEQELKVLKIKMKK